MVVANEDHVELPECMVPGAEQRVADVDPAETERLHVQRHLVEGHVLLLNEVELEVVDFHHDQVGLLQRFLAALADIELDAMRVELQEVGTGHVELLDQRVDLSDRYRVGIFATAFRQRAAGCVSFLEGALDVFAVRSADDMLDRKLLRQLLPVGHEAVVHVDHQHLKVGPDIAEEGDIIAPAGADIDQSRQRLRFRAQALKTGFGAGSAIEAEGARPAMSATASLLRESFALIRFQNVLVRGAQSLPASVLR